MFSIAIDKQKKQINNLKQKLNELQHSNKNIKVLNQYELKLKKMEKMIDFTSKMVIKKKKQKISIITIIKI